MVLAWHLRGTHSLGVYNVQDYGAAGDGVASDTAEIQAVLNAAADGDVVYFPPGTYMVSGLTLSTDGVKLLGAGATLKRNAGSVMLTVSGDRTTINGLTFNANYTAFLDADKYSINIANGTADTTITDCRFVNGGQATAIWMAGDPVGTPIQRTTVRGCYFAPTTAYGAGVGLVYDVADLLITECRFILAADHGVHDPQSIAVRSYTGTVNQVPRRLRIIDNDFEMQSGTAGGPGYPYAIGVGSDGSATFDPWDVVVAGNTIRALATRSPALIRGRDQRRRREQHVHGPASIPAEYGFEVGGREILVADNVIDGGGSCNAAIILNSASNCHVTDNNIKGLKTSGGTPVGILLYGDGNDITQNVVANNTVAVPNVTNAFGIRVYQNTNASHTSHADRTIITGNNVIGAGKTDTFGIGAAIEDLTGATLDSTLIANNSVTNVDKAFGINGTTNTEIARNKVTNVNNTLYTAIANTNLRQLDNSWRANSRRSSRSRSLIRKVVSWDGGRAPPGRYLSPVQPPVGGVALSATPPACGPRPCFGACAVKRPRLLSGSRVDSISLL